jgi:hypothetical protein
MQAGYRTNPIYSTKALKASLKVRKLDNAVYGSDTKFQVAIDALSRPSVATQTTPTQDNVASIQSPPVIDTSVPYIALGESAFSPGVPVSKAHSTVSSIPAAPPRSTISSNASIASALSNELLRTIHSGITPSEVRKTKQKTTVAPTIVSVAQVSTTPNPPPPAPVGSTLSSGPQKLETKTEIPITTAPQTPPVNTSAEAQAKSPTPPTSPVGHASDVKTTLDAVSELKGSEYSLDDINLQSLAGMIMASDNTDKSKTISAYDKEGTPLKDSLRISRDSDNRYSFIRVSGTEKTKGNRPRTKKILEHPVDIDIPKSLMLSYDDTVHSTNTVGRGLDSDSKKVHWAHRRAHADRNFVMYPAFRNGNIRYYVSPKHTAVVSYNNASPHFLNIVRDVIDTGTFKTGDYAILTPQESTAAHTFIKWAKPIIPRGAQLNTADAGELYDLRNRYKVLVGELAAGNQGQAIKNEMIDILHTLQAKGALSRFKVNGLIKGLEEL